VAEYLWRQPVGGKSITWKPLTVGQELACQMANARPELAPIRPYDNLRTRITDYDGKPVCSLDDLKSWDSLDVEMFSEEVEARESERRAALMVNASKSAPGSVIELEAALMEFRASSNNLSRAAERALAAVKAVPPLGPT